MGRALDAKSKKEVVALTAVMIRDGRVPTPEEARRAAAERRRTERLTLVRMGAALVTSRRARPPARRSRP
jgi:hypothetical protein